MTEVPFFIFDFFKTQTKITPKTAKQNGTEIVEGL